MQAIVMTAAGGPEVLQRVEMDEPEITSPQQIKVRVEAAGVNPIDTKLRGRGVFYPDALPAILGLDGAGVVQTVGTGVTRFKPGDEVWYCNGGLGGDPGNYARFHVLHEDLAEPKPGNIGFEQAGAGPLVLITAWEALFDRAGLKPGQSVLIHAGAGGVGHVAIQLARLGGARVITTVSGPEKAAWVRELGADEVIDYPTQELLPAVMDWTGGRGVDIVLDTVGSTVLQTSIPALAFGGDLVTLLDPGPVDWKEARNRNLRISFELMLTPHLRDLPRERARQGEILRRCAQWIEAGKLRIEVSRGFPLAQAEQAHRLIEQGHVQGKLVLLPG